MRFIGQSAGKGEFESAKGMPQKEQRAVVKRFRSGEYNVLVATSIGEEGHVGARRQPSQPEPAAHRLPAAASASAHANYRGSLCR